MQPRMHCCLSAVDAAPCTGKTWPSSSTDLQAGVIVLHLIPQSLGHRRYAAKLLDGLGNVICIGSAGWQQQCVADEDPFEEILRIKQGDEVLCLDRLVIAEVAAEPTTCDHGDMPAHVADLICLLISNLLQGYHDQRARPLP